MYDDVYAERHFDIMRKGPHVNKARLRKMIGVGMLSAVAFVLQIMEMPMPVSPPFARLDLSDLPALIGSFAYGPLWGGAIEGIKNCLHFGQSTTGGMENWRTS